MPEERELSIEIMRVLARQAEVQLTDEELQELMPAVMRNLQRAGALKKWVDPEVEPPVNSLVPRS